MKKVKFIKSKKEWTKLVRHIRINGEILNIEEGDYIENKSCRYENGHAVTKHINGNIIWQSFTMFFDRSHNILVKEVSYFILLDSEKKFLKGTINGFVLGFKSLNKEDYKVILDELQEKFISNEFWDLAENEELTDAVVSYV